MKVKKLIELLQKHHPESHVVIWDMTGETVYLPIKYVSKNTCDHKGCEAVLGCDAAEWWPEPNPSKDRDTK